MRKSKIAGDHGSEISKCSNQFVRVTISPFGSS